ncbi:MAG: glycosyltransferase family 2 protein [Candidatus Zambryskibacteria bacterium]|nr:glycosyltransferase family 2 protein [Candidatus Zambryskibacteria bacterium]
MVSIVIPIFNEKESVAILHAELVSVLSKLDRPFEIIFIDDGSTDGTFEVLSKLKPATIIRFARNFGKSQALQAGFDEASGEYVITMDGDLQDDPKEIPDFLRTIKEKNADLVVGWKQKRLDPGNKKIASRLANKVTGLLTGVNVHDMNCCFKIYRGEVARELQLYGDLHRFIPALVASHGHRVIEMPVNHRARQYGVSKYGLSRLFTSLFDFFSIIFIHRFTDRPMHFFGGSGFIFGSIGFLILLYLTFEKLWLDALIGNRPLLLFGVLLVLLGVQLFSLGFIGDMIIRSGPTGTRNFVVKEKIN